MNYSLRHPGLINALFGKLPNGHPHDESIRHLLLDFILKDWILSKESPQNGYRLSFDLVDYPGGFVDPTSPEYVTFVRDLKKNINLFSSILKVVNDYIRSQYLNEWIKYGPEPDDIVNFHKILVVIRRSVISEYQYMIQLRVFWKKMYKFQRSVKLASKGGRDVIFA